MFSLDSKKKILNNAELFVLDMDGTFYLENDILDGSLDFLEAVKRAGKRYIFLRADIQSVDFVHRNPAQPVSPAVHLP